MLAPRGTTTQYLLFNKYYDDRKDPSEINFNLIRTFNANTDSSIAIEGNSENAVKVYSLNIPLK